MNNKSGTFDIEDGGLNDRLERLVQVLDSTNKTLEKVSTDIINANERQSRMQNKFQKLYLGLTALIVLAAFVSVFFSYKSVKISSSQKTLQMTKLVIDTLQQIADFETRSKKTSETNEDIENPKTSLSGTNKTDRSPESNKPTPQPTGKAEQ